MANRITDAQLEGKFVNGQILYGADLNKIVDVFKEGVNANKSDINLILSGVGNGIIGVYSADILDKLSNVGTTGDMAINISPDTGVQLIRKMNNTTWEVLSSMSILDLMNAMTEIVEELELKMEQEDLDNLKDEINSKVSVVTFNMQMLEKLNVKPNGTDLLIIGGKINPVYFDDTMFSPEHIIVNSEAEMLALEVDANTVVVRADQNNELYILVRTPANVQGNWNMVSPNAVTMVAGRTGNIILGISDIDGLTQAMNLKVNTITFESEVTRLTGLINEKVDEESLEKYNIDGGFL